MGVKRLVGVVLIVVGILGVVYGGFTYTSKEKAAEIGPVEIQVEKENKVNVPMWAGVVVLVAGVVLVSTGGKR